MLYARGPSKVNECLSVTIEMLSSCSLGLPWVIDTVLALVQSLQITPLMYTYSFYYTLTTCTVIDVTL